MQYFEGLGLNREPFSNSPDPDLFYRSKNHMECLQQMEIAVRLRRGLNVVTGDVGTGKTTLCRQLIRVLGHEESIETFLLLDPYFKDPLDFLRNLNLLFGVPEDRIEGSFPRLKENLREFLRQRGVERNSVITLIVDEGQKITGECLELLRELLNFETNAFKLLQIVIFAQKEFNQMLKERPNLADRVNFHFHLEPLDYAETRRMIETRLGLCSKDARAPELFTNAALWSIYRRTGGYPRKIVQLCHKALLLMAASGKTPAGFFTMFRASRGIGPSPWTVRRGLVWAGALLWLVIPAWILVGGFTPQLRRVWDDALEGRLFSSLSAHEQRVPAEVAVAEASRPSQPAQPSAVAEKPLEPLFSDAAPEEDPTRRAERLAGLPVPAPADEAAGADQAARPGEGVPALAPEPSAEHAGEHAPTIPAAVEVAAAGGGHVASPPAEAPRVAPIALGAPGAPAAPATPASEGVVEIFGETAAPGDAGARASSPGAKTAEEIAGIKTDAPAKDASAGDLAASGDAVREPASPQAAMAPPGFLGSVVVQKGFVVSLRAAKVYGSGGKRIMGMFSGANPEIDDLSAVRPGQRVSFPAIVASAPPAGSCLVRVARTDSLDMAFGYLAQAPANWPGLTLFAYFSPTQGLIFDVVMDKIFADRAQAGGAAAALPPDLASKAVIVDSFEPGTVFYTDLGLPEPTQMAPKSEEKAVARNDSLKS